jgi:hypothetical protein
MTTNSELSTISLAANTTYIVEGALLVVTANATPDIAATFDTPGSGTATLRVGFSGGAGSVSFITTDNTGVKLADLSAVDNTLIIGGYIANGGTAGTLTFKWGQNTSNANTVSLMPGSYIKVTAQ